MKNLIYIIGIAIILFFVGLTIYTYVTVNGQEVITPYNTNNPVSTVQYCGFKDRIDCKSISQNEPIPVSAIKDVSN